jgi:uncharacterized protein YybS (DUF2232 family)
MSLNPQADHDLIPRLKAAVLGMVGSFIMFTAYLAVPPIGIFSGVLAPFPACYVRLLHGRLSSVILTFGVTAAVSALFGVFAGFLYLGMCGAIGLLLPELLSRGFSGSRAMVWTTAANLAVLVAGIAAYCMSTDLDLHQYISAEITSSLNQALTIYEKGGVKGEDLDLVKQSMKTVADLLYRLYPAFVTIMLIIMAGCNLALLKKTSSISALALNIGDFASFKNPEMLVWLFLASGFSMLTPSPLVATPALNILMIVGLCYFLQGMAVVSTVIARQTFSKVLRIILYVTLILQPYLAGVLAIIGLFDLWADFRTIKLDKQENL